MATPRTSCLPLAAALVLALAACAPDAPDELASRDNLAAVPSPVAMASPAAAASEEPDLHAGPDGRVYLTWFEEREGRWLFLLSELRTGGDGSGGAPEWSPPRVVSDRDHGVNWANFPVVRALPDGRVAVFYPVRGPQGGVHVSWSADGGETWSEPVVPHGPRSEFEGAPGFVSLLPWHDGSVGVVWLNEVMPESTLNFASVGEGGATGPTVLDARACDCCQTSSAVASSGPVVVYRDRSPDEVRDMAVVRFVDGAWTEPRPVHHDGWVINSCPVNGPMVDADGERVAVAWFTAPEDVAQVNVAFSDDSGATFGAPVRVDDGSPVGRVAARLLPGGDAVVSWLERVGDHAEVRVRRVRRDGSMSPATTVAPSDAARASGFPRMALAGDRLFFAWTDSRGDAPHVRVATTGLGGP